MLEISALLERRNAELQSNVQLVHRMHLEVEQAQANMSADVMAKEAALRSSLELLFEGRRQQYESEKIAPLQLQLDKAEKNCKRLQESFNSG